jgi:uncharacterized protein YgbK (DUF1537 family)
MWEQGDSPLFAVGSQGIEQALIAYWRSEELLPKSGNTPGFPATERIAVVSGSVSPITAAQISHAEANGFQLIRLDAVKAVDARQLTEEVERVSKIAERSLAAGRDPLIFTAAGPRDAAVAAFRAAVGASSEPLASVNDRLGAALGDILKSLIHASGIRRVVISGGDTSGQAALRLGIDALTAVAPMAPGAPLCRAHSTDPAIDGLELILKGGQTGSPDFFTEVRAGRR